MQLRDFFVRKERLHLKLRLKRQASGPIHKGRAIRVQETSGVAYFKLELQGCLQNDRLVM